MAHGWTYFKWLYTTYTIVFVFYMEFTLKMYFNKKSQLKTVSRSFYGLYSSVTKMRKVSPAWPASVIHHVRPRPPGHMLSGPSGLDAQRCVASEVSGPEQRTSSLQASVSSPSVWGR